MNGMGLGAIQLIRDCCSDQIQGVSQTLETAVPAVPANDLGRRSTEVRVDKGVRINRIKPYPVHPVILSEHSGAVRSHTRRVRHRPVSNQAVINSACATKAAAIAHQMPSVPG